MSAPQPLFPGLNSNIPVEASSLSAQEQSSADAIGSANAFLPDNSVPVYGTSSHSGLAMGQTSGLAVQPSLVSGCTPPEIAMWVPHSIFPVVNPAQDPSLSAQELSDNSIPVGGTSSHSGLSMGQSSAQEQSSAYAVGSANAFLPDNSIPVGGTSSHSGLSIGPTSGLAVQPFLVSGFTPPGIAMSVTHSVFPVVNPAQDPLLSSSASLLAERFKCLRFSPDDVEIITDFLEPKIRKDNMDFSLIDDMDIYLIISGSTGPWTKGRYPFFRKNHYWFFAKREPVKRGSEIVPLRKLGPKTNFLGTWRQGRRSTPILKERKVIGLKQRLNLMTKENLKTGWHMYEYQRYSKAFEVTVVSHIVYEEDNNAIENEAEDPGTDVIDEFDNVIVPVTSSTAAFTDDEEFLEQMGDVDVDDLF